MRKTTLKHNKLFITLISAFLIVGSANGNHISENKIIKTASQKTNYLGSDACGAIKELRKQYIVVPSKIDVEKEIIKSVNEKIDKVFKVSAYTLAYQSCQKSRGSKDYGITSSGYDLKGHTLVSARTIATDPIIIPTGTKVMLTFKNSKYKKWDGIYTSRDIGGGIKSFQIDLFVGSGYGSNKFAKDFGVTYAIVTILED